MKAIRLLRPKRGFQWLQKGQLQKQSDCYSDPWMAAITRFFGSWGVLWPTLLQGRFMNLGATSISSNGLKFIADQVAFSFIFFNALFLNYFFLNVNKGPVIVHMNSGMTLMHLIGILMEVKYVGGLARL